MQTNLSSAVFDTSSEADKALRDLREAGVSDSALSVIAQHDGTTTTTTGDGEIADDNDRSVLRGILGGGALGAGLGVAALAIPGVGPLVAAGAIAASAIPGAAAIGAAAGAAFGTLNETLLKHGLDREDADYYGDRIGQGGVLVTVNDSGSLSSDDVHDILYRNGGHSAKRSRATAY